MVSKELLAWLLDCFGFMFTGFTLFGHEVTE